MNIEEMNRLVKHILYQFCFTAIIYSGIYFVYSFTTWSMVNPFIWLTQMPKYEPFERFGILLGVFIYEIVINVFTAGFLDFVEQQKNSNNKNRE